MLNNWKLIALLCLTLGLTPYFPEPHLWGKLRWLAGGAKGMAAKDWFDLLLHGLPFLLLIRLFVVNILKNKSK